MAKIEDYIKNDGDSEDKPTEQSELFAADETEESQPKEAEQQPDADTLPEKYNGKSIAELVRMHQEAESVIGRQGNEVGELRGTVDKLIDTNLQNAQVPNKKDEGTGEEVDFYSNPEKATSDVVDKHPVVKEMRETSAKLARQAKQQDLLSRHPDVDEVFAEAGFREWIQKSQHRMNQLSKADKDFDVEAGDELLSSYKEVRALKAPASDKKKTTVSKADPKVAATGSVTGGAGSTRTGKLVYRADIRKLQREDKRRYNEMLPEIRKAYSEGRVRGK
tara:strand:- start:2122 stop:2952 length:831 start_codon:yes stop_codon:yes gene_type:complete